MDYDQYLNAVQQQINANNSWSASQAQKQMEFQERLSSSAHQREVKDLQAAGLNPILSANSGATTPNGAMANGSNDSVQALVSMMNKFLDIESDNAKAQLASKVGYLNTSSSAKGNNNLLTDFLMALGVNRTQAQGVGNVVHYIVGDKSMDQFFDTANNVLTSLTNLNNVDRKTETHKDSNGVTFKTSSTSKTDNTAKAGFNYFVDSVVQTARNIVDSVKNAPPDSLAGTIKKGFKKIFIS